MACFRAAVTCGGGALWSIPPTSRHRGGSRRRRPPRRPADANSAIVACSTAGRSSSPQCDLRPVVLTARAHRDAVVVARKRVDDHRRWSRTPSPRQRARPGSSSTRCLSRSRSNGSFATHFLLRDPRESVPAAWRAHHGGLSNAASGFPNRRSDQLRVSRSGDRGRRPDSGSSTHSHPPAPSARGRDRLGATPSSSPPIADPAPTATSAFLASLACE